MLLADTVCFALQVVDVDRLFTNMESVCAVSAELLHRLQEATAEPDPEAVLTGKFPPDSHIHSYHSSFLLWALQYSWVRCKVSELSLWHKGRVHTFVQSGIQCNRTIPSCRYGANV